MLTVKMKNKYDTYKPKEGTENKMIDEADKANQSRAEELDIKTMIKKYGIVPFEFMNKVSEPLYLDMTGDELTINQRLKMKEETDAYFDSMPANIRENYHHNKEAFYQMLVNGDFNQLQNDGVVTQEYIDNYNKKKYAKDNQIAELNKQIQQMQSTLNTLKKGETTNVQKD